LPEIQAAIQAQRARDEATLNAIGRIEARQLTDRRGSLQDHEFKVYSQAGEDGIIQFLARHVPVRSQRFIEFGVEDYQEANTRFLLVNNHWSGLVMDGDPGSVKRIHADPVYWNSDLTTKAAFVTRDNVNQLLIDAGFEGEVGLLSIDVDGNDYWIFDAISAIQPAIAIVEYNYRFGPTRAVTIPYDPGFVRSRSDPSWLICGASLTAIVRAATRKGMSFVGCNSFGNNAFFVRTDLLPEWMPALDPADGFTPGKFKESLVHEGVEFFATQAQEEAWIAAATLVDVE
jgi:hypothetical protein